MFSLREHRSEAQEQGSGKFAFQPGACCWRPYKPEVTDSKAAAPTKADQVKRLCQRSWKRSRGMNRGSGAYAELVVQPGGVWVWPSYCHTYARGKGQAQLIPRLALLLRRRGGDRTHLVDSAAGRGPAATCRRCHRGHRRPTARSRGPPHETLCAAFDLRHRSHQTQQANAAHNPALLIRVVGLARAGEPVLYYAFDAWMEREFPTIAFERYVDDAVVRHPVHLDRARCRARIAGHAPIGRPERYVF